MLLLKWYVKIVRFLSEKCRSLWILHLVPIENEFQYVFPDDVPSLPPVREVEFSIKLVSGTRPILVAPYRCLLWNWKSLRFNLKCLLQRSLFDLVLHLGGSMVLVVKKKDGSMRLCIYYKKLNNVYCEEQVVVTTNWLFVGSTSCRGNVFKNLFEVGLSPDQS